MLCFRADEDVEEILPACARHRAKFLQFHTDVRPAYFGTWRKKSRYIKPRRPLAEDRQRFDYENDSADEWEEEEPGESVDSGDDVSTQTVPAPQRSVDSGRGCNMGWSVHDNY